jgi:hypothetical protein
MRCIAVPCFTAPGVKSWTVDKDCLLVYAQTTSGNVVVQEDPSLASTAISGGPTANSGVRSDILTYLNTGSGNQFLQIPMQIPLSAGKQIFFANASVCWVILYLEDVTISAE